VSCFVICERQRHAEMLNVDEQYSTRVRVRVVAVIHLLLHFPIPIDYMSLLSHIH
jgi:hypothetical protein